MKWSADWQLPINIDKCSVLPINRSGVNSAREYYLNGSYLSKLTSVSDLGVEYSFNLSVQSHTSSIVSKARQRVGFLFRGFSTRNVSFLRKAYITYIRPLLEYNSNIWNPTQIQLINLLEGVQRMTTMLYKASCSYF